MGLLIKIDHTVSHHVKEDLGGFALQIKNSGRMYSWVKDEDVEQTALNFALENRRATVGDFIEWTKRTYLDRAEAKKNGVEYTNFKLIGDYNPTRPQAGTTEGHKAEIAQHGVSAVDDYIPARAKQRTDLKRVEESEAEKDDLRAIAEAREINAQRAQAQAKTEALAAEATASFEAAKPPQDLSGFKAIEPGQQPDQPDAGLSPLEKHLKGQK